MTDEEVVDLLERMDRGDVKFWAEGPSWKEVSAGNVRFRLADGRCVVVFNDCDSFDYVDHVEDPNGVTLWDFPANLPDPDVPRSPAAIWRPQTNDRAWRNAKVRP